MYRHILPLVLLCVIFLGPFFLFANTPWLINYLGPQWLQQNISGLEVKTFHVDQQRYRWPDHLKLTNFSAEIQYQGKHFQINTQDVFLDGTLKSLGQKEPMKMEVVGGFLKTETMELRNVKLALIFPFRVFRNKIFEGKGMLDVGGLRFLRYAAKNVAVRFGVTPDQIQIFESSAALYGGKFQSGQVSFQFHPGSLLISWSELTGLDAVQLQQISKPIFAGLTGRINGTWRLVGDTAKVEVLAIILSMPEGGIMSPELLQRLAGNMHEGSDKKQIEALIQEKQPLAFDTGNLYIQNIDPTTVALVVAIESKAKDLHIQERILVPVEEGLREFLLKN